MKFKKLLAGFLAGAMVLGCVPQTVWGENAGQVQAEETTSTDFSQYGAYLTGLTDQQGRGCSFIAKSASSVEGSATYIKKDSTTIQSGSSEGGELLFDGITSPANNDQFLHIENNQGNRQDNGDYVGLIFDKAIDMQSVRFTLGSNSDAYKTSKLQYLPEGTTDWEDVEGEEFGNVSVCEREFESPMQAVKGIRLVCTATETQYGWLRVYEIEVGQAVQVKSQYTNIAKGAIITTDADNQDTSALVDGNVSELYKFSTNQWTEGMEKSILLSYGDARAMDSFKIVFEHENNEQYGYSFEYSILAKNTSTDTAWTTIADHVIANRTNNYQQVYNQTTEKQFNMVKIVMHSCRTNGTYDGKFYGWAAIAEFEVYGATTEISTSMMSVTAGSAYDGSQANVLDGNINTIWHSNYNADTANHDKHYLIFTFNEKMSVDGISYKARPNVDGNGKPNNTGNINSYTLWVSEDASGDNWTQITLADGATNGNFEDTIAWQKATFSSVTAKRIKLKVESAHRETDTVKHASAAEVRFTGTRINPSESDTAMWKVNDVQRSEIASVTAGSACPSATGDSDASAAIDGNTGTWWHTNYKTNNGATSDEGKIHKSWLDMKFTEATMVDGIRVLPREDNNGIITQYEVWVSNVDVPTDLSSITDVTTYTATWQKEYTKVCEGTWLNNGNGTDKWKVVSFEPVKAKHVRLVAIATYNRWTSTSNAYASMVEFRATKPTEIYDCFNGGSLRMDYANTYDKASMRYEYQFPTTLNGMNLQENAWSWKYGTSLDASGKIAGDRVQTVEENRFKVVDGTCYSNLVFTEIAKANYNRDLYAQLVIPYANTDGEELKVYTSVENRSVAGIAEAVKANGSTEEQKTYATALLEAMNTGN